ncbi:MAG: response regulator [Elusimicrobia bacterium]|nr:response regulator [Elusimicrobiota bacterium]
MIKKILIVDDDKSILSFLEKAILKFNSLNIVKRADSVSGAIQELLKNYYDILITDINIPDESGFYLIEYTKKNFPNCKIIAMSGEPSLLRDAKRLKLEGYLSKPFSVLKLAEELKIIDGKKVL